MERQLTLALFLVAAALFEHCTTASTLYQKPKWLIWENTKMLESQSQEPQPHSENVLDYATSVRNEEAAECLGTPFFKECILDPCQFLVCNTSSSGIQVECWPNKCVKPCNANFFSKSDGRMLWPNDCCDPSKIHACANLCTTCSKFPNAVCQTNRCGTCKAEYYMGTVEVTDFCGSAPQ